MLELFYQYEQHLYILLVLLVLSGLLYWVNTSFNHKKYKTIVLICLWSFSTFFFYKIVNEFWLGPANFESVKEERYQRVIKKLTDIRDSELAFKSVRGQFTDNWDSLVRFIERDSFTLTQRRDSSVLDKEMTKLYGGVKTYKNIVIVDTLGFISVRDSLFVNKVITMEDGTKYIDWEDRYKKMMFVYWDYKVDFDKNNISERMDEIVESGYASVGPYKWEIYDWAKSEPDTTRFELRSGSIDKNGKDIPVFEAMIKKSIILYDQDETLKLTEDLVQGVNGVNGKSLKVGSMYDINTNGNWPKNYKKNQ